MSKGVFSSQKNSKKFRGGKGVVSFVVSCGRDLMVNFFENFCLEKNRSDFLNFQSVFIK